MDAKSFIKIGLFGISIPAVNIGSAFGWKCPEGHKHGKNEMCTTTGARFCDKCKEPHNGYDVCPWEVFRIASDGVKIVVLPFDTPNEKILALQREFGYETNGSKKDNVNPFYLQYDSSEVKRLNEYIQALMNKTSPKKSEDKKWVGKNRKILEDDSDKSKAWEGIELRETGNLEKKPVKFSQKKKRLCKKREGNLAKEKKKEYKWLKKFLLDESAEEAGEEESEEE